MRNKILQRKSITGYFYPVIGINIIGIFELKSDVELLSKNTIVLYKNKFKSVQKAENWIKSVLTKKDLKEFNIDDGNHLRINGVHLRNRERAIQNLYSFIENISIYNERYDLYGPICIKISEEDNSNI